MTNPLQTIPNLPPAITVSGPEQIWINQAGVDRRTTLAEIAELADLGAGVYLPITGGSLAGPGNLTVNGTFTAATLAYAQTPAPGDNSGQIATTSFVTDAIDTALGGATLVNSFNGRSGDVTLTTADITAAGGATTADLGNYLPLSGGTLTGPLLVNSNVVIQHDATIDGYGYATTPAVGDNSTKLATTAFVEAAIAAQPQGSVTSVGLVAPNIFTVTNSPITTSGDLTLTSVAQNANTVYAGPSSGPAGTPTFRVPTAGDVTAWGGATAADLTGYLPLAGGALTGPTTALTPTVGDNSTNIATTAYVEAAIAAAGGGGGGGGGTVTSVALAAPNIFTVTGSPVTTAGTLTLVSVAQAANTIYAGPATGAAAGPTFRVPTATDITAWGGATSAQLGNYLPLTGGAITGNLSVSGSLTAPTVTAGDNSTNVATTAFVEAAIAAIPPGGGPGPEPANTVYAGPTSGAPAVPTFRALAATDIPNLSASYLSVNGGTITGNLSVSGNLTAPTPAPGNNSTEVATTAFVDAAIAAIPPPTGGGTVTSVGLQMPALFGVANSPITTSGVIDVFIPSQGQNTVWAGPTSGVGQPTFRALTPPDIPTLPYLPLTGGAISGNLSVSGNLTAPTPPTSDNSTEVATTAFVHAAMGAAGAGTVTSVGLTADSNFTVTGSPVTTTGNLGIAFNTQAPNSVLAGPASGATAAAPTFRALAAADISSIAVTSFDGRTGAVTLTTTDITNAGGATSAQLGGYLPLTGGAITGPVTAPTPAAADNSTNVATTAYVRSNFVALTGGTMSGQLTISGPAGVRLNKAAGNNSNNIFGATSGSTRWIVVLGDNTSETGSNAGSNFDINSYSDTAVLLGTQFSINRATGVASFTAIPTAPTAAPGDSSSNLATTAFIDDAITAITPAGGFGTVTSVGLSMPSSVFGVIGSPVTGAGNLTVAFNGQPVGTVFAAPAAGGQPVFRALTAADMPPGVGGVTISDTAPATPSPGNLWFDSVGLQTYIWYDDPTSSQWVPVINQGGLTTDAPSDGTLYGRENGAWTSVTAALGGYLPLTGGTLTGPLTMSPSTPGNSVINLNDAAGNIRSLMYETAGSPRWNLNAGAVAESGANAGSNFNITAYSDAGAILSTPLTIARATGAATFSAPITVTPATAGQSTINLNDAAGNARRVRYMTAGAPRWDVGVTGTAETGGSVGSDLLIISYNDLGSANANPAISIARVSQNITCGGAISATSYTATSGNIYCTSTGLQRGLFAQTSNVNRWFVGCSGGGEGGGGNSGSDFAIQNYDNSGNLLGSAIAITRSNSQISCAGSLVINGGNFYVNGTTGGCYFNLNANAGTSRQLVYFSANSQRWTWFVDGTAESGGDAGSNMNLGCQHDNGSWNVTTVTISRASGTWQFTNPIINGSDLRQKQDVTPISDALTLVKKLVGVSYERKSRPGKRELGLIAQDVRGVVPEAIEEVSEPEMEGATRIGTDDDPLLGVSYTQFTALLIEAVKQLSAEVDALKAQVGAPA